jgi:hypothetical protein
MRAREEETDADAFPHRCFAWGAPSQAVLPPVMPWRIA